MTYGHRGIYKPFPNAVSLNCCILRGWVVFHVIQNKKNGYTVDEHHTKKNLQHQHFFFFFFWTKQETTGSFFVVVVNPIAVPRKLGFLSRPAAVSPIAVPRELGFLSRLQMR